MTITNNTNVDITFELDVNKTLKGIQSRLTVRANSVASVNVEDILLLVQDKGFQAQRTVGNITIGYSAADTTFLSNILAFLNSAY